MKRAGRARRKRMPASRRISRGARAGMSRRSKRRLKKRLMSEKTTIVRRPGPTVERKQASTLAPVTQPKMIMGVLGGMRTPRMEAQVMSAVAKALG